MIGMQTEILLTGLIFLPAVFGFAGCIFPRIFLWLSGLLLLSYSYLAWSFNRQGLDFSYRLVGVGGIEFSWDSYSFPMIFGACIALLITFSLFSARFTHYFYQICMVLLTALIISFTTVDLVSLFIALELTGFSAFLLIADRNDNRSLFNAFQYLIGGGLAMLIYLVGVVQAFTFSGSFLLVDLVKAPPTAICLIIAGLLTKAGVFLGLWVPNIYSYANCQSASILSGCVTCAGIAPIARLSQALSPIAESMVVVGVLSGVIAAGYAVFERESGRALGWSSVSQLGLAMLSPSYACLYAMQHGICKALLFSTLHASDRHNSSPHHGSGHESHASSPQRSTSELLRVVVFCLASLSIMGFPLLAGFMTKNLLKYDLPYQADIIFTTSALLTSTVYARLIYDRLKAYKSHLKEYPFSLGKFSENLSYFPNLALMASAIFLIGFAVQDFKLYTYSNIESAIVSAIIGVIMFVSVQGIQANEFVKPVTKTIDLVGAPFLVAALLLANLLYFKI